MCLKSGLNQLHDRSANQNYKKKKKKYLKLLDVKIRIIEQIRKKII